MQISGVGCAFRFNDSAAPSLSLSRPFDTVTVILVDQVNAFTDNVCRKVRPTFRYYRAGIVSTIYKRITFLEQAEALANTPALLLAIGRTYFSQTLIIEHFSKASRPKGVKYITIFGHNIYSIST